MNIINNNKNCHIYVIILIFVIIALICIYHDSDHEDNLEHYDARMTNITLTQCGTECTQAQNCAGFGYKPIGGMCYLSKAPILGSPEESLYRDEYTKLDRRCNKINRIMDDDRVDGLSLTQNSIYVCADGQNNVSTEFQYANYGASSLDGPKSTVFDTSDTDRINPTPVSYKLTDIVYPDEKKDIVPGFITDPYKDDEEKKKYGFIESDKEYLGQYALAHQCVVNVPLFDCLKYCENNKQCTGAEWNKAMVKTDGEQNYLYENVCCPKAIIRKVIPRRNQFSRGKFYVKKPLNSILNRDKVVMTKAELDSTIPMNDRFQLSMTDFKVPNVNNPEEQTDFSHVTGLIAPAQ